MNTPLCTEKKYLPKIKEVKKAFGVKPLFDFLFVAALFKNIIVLVSFILNLCISGQLTFQCQIFGSLEKYHLFYVNDDKPHTVPVLSKTIPVTSYKKGRGEENIFPFFPSLLKRFSSPPPFFFPLYMTSYRNHLPHSGTDWASSSIICKILCKH